MTDKYCPLKQHVYDEKLRKCDGEKCQIWVRLAKPMNAELECQYEGCGLVTAIPWILVKGEVK